MGYGHIVETHVPGAEITRLINTKIGPAIEGEDEHTVAIALLTCAILMMKPEVSVEQLQEGITWLSQGMCLLLADMVPETEGVEDTKPVVAN